MANGDTTTQDTDQQPSVDDLLKLLAASNQQIGQLPATLPTQAAPPAAPVAAPRNRTFMGPNIGGPTNPQEFFGELPAGRTIMPPSMRNPAPLSPNAQAALQGRLAAATQPESDQALLTRMQAVDRPGSRTIAVSNPPAPVEGDGYIKLQSQQGLKKDLDAGVPANVAWAKWGPGILGKLAPSSKTSTPPVWHPANTTTGAPGYFDTPGGTIHIPPATKPTEAQGTPAQKLSLYKTLATEHSKDTEGKTAYDERQSGKATPENQAAAMKWKQDEDAVQAMHKDLLPKKPAKSAPSTSTATAPAVKPPEQAKKSGDEVTRVTKDGRRAVFDSKTKQFLRYAD